MDKLKTLILFFRQKLGRKAENVEPEEIGKYSMNEGEPDKVFGFRREVIKGVVIFFITVLALATIFASSEEEEGKKPPPKCRKSKNRKTNCRTTMKH